MPGFRISRIPARFSAKIIRAGDLVGPRLPVLRGTLSRVGQEPVGERPARLEQVGSPHPGSSGSRCRPGRVCKRGRLWRLRGPRSPRKSSLTPYFRSVEGERPGLRALTMSVFRSQSGLPGVYVEVRVSGAAPGPGPCTTSGARGRVDNGWLSGRALAATVSVDPEPPGKPRSCRSRRRHPAARRAPQRANRRRNDEYRPAPESSV